MKIKIFVKRVVLNESFQRIKKLLICVKQISSTNVVYEQIANTDDIKYVIAVFNIERF